MKPDLHPGDVLDIKGLKLELGKGPNRSSLLSSRSRDVSLYKYTQLLLVPASIAFLPAAPPLAAANASNPLNGAVPMEPALKPAAAIPPILSKSVNLPVVLSICPSPQMSSPVTVQHQ